MKTLLYKDNGVVNHKGICFLLNRFRNKQQKGSIIAVKIVFPASRSILKIGIVITCSKWVVSFPLYPLKRCAHYMLNALHLINFYWRAKTGL